MKIRNITRTIIEAEDGKVLVRKSDGWIAGKSYPLGYNYYEAGIPLAEKKLETPDDYEEIDKPEDYEQKPIINHIRRLKRTNELIQKNIKEMNELELSAVDALEVVEWFPKWGVDIKEGDSVTKGTKFQYEGKLYAVLQDHTILAHYYPSINTASLYVEVTPEYDDQGNENGTKESPIEYGGNMVLEEGKYYVQDGVVYYCDRDSINAVYHNLSELVGYYVERVE